MELLRTYRGYDILRDGDGFAYRHTGTDFILRICGTAWGCICSIDEELAP